MKLHLNLAIVTLALATGVSTAVAQTNWLSDDFHDPTLTGWTTLGYPGTLTQINQQLLIYAWFYYTNQPVKNQNVTLEI